MKQLEIASQVALLVLPFLAIAFLAYVQVDFIRWRRRRRREERELDEMHDALLRRLSERCPNCGARAAPVRPLPPSA